MANTTNINVAIDNAFFTELGKLVAKYAKYFGITPDNVGKIEIPFPTGNGDDDQTPPVAPVAVKVNRVREYGKEGLPKNIYNGQYTADDESMEILRRVVANHPEIGIGGEQKVRYANLTCPTAATLIIKRCDPEGRLIDEALEILINAKQHLSGGITRNKLEMVTRILALHQRRGRSKVKELLTEILAEQTINSLLVLAKETKLYVQRSNIDMLTMYTEARIAEKADGIRNQFTVAA